MNANLCGSISLYCMSGHEWPLQPSSLTRGRPPHPPRPLLPRPKPRWRRGAKRLDGADVRCEGSSRIFCKIHYRAFASPTAPKNGMGRCTLTLQVQNVSRGDLYVWREQESHTDFAGNSQSRKAFRRKAQTFRTWFRTRYRNKRFFSSDFSPSFS